MTDFKVKYDKSKNKSHTLPEIKTRNVIEILKKHKGWVALGLLGLLIVLYYTAGLVLGLTIVLILILVFLFVANGYDLAKWALAGKTQDDKAKRWLVICLAGFGLFGLYAIVKWLVLPTEWGQTVSGFIWKQF